LLWDGVRMNGDGTVKKLRKGTPGKGKSVPLQAQRVPGS
jgi:hypothetical protein